MHSDIQRILYTDGQIRSRVAEVARSAGAVFSGKNVLAVCKLKGAVVFFSDFIRLAGIPLELDFMSVSSYGSGIVSSGSLNIKKDLDADVAGRDVMIVEDIIDSGFTLACLKELLLSRGARSVTVVTLLDKRARRAYDIRPDFNCFEIPDEFVVGYGLDYDEKYRSLPYIGVLKPCIYQK